MEQFIIFMHGYIYQLTPLLSGTEIMEPSRITCIHTIIKFTNSKICQLLILHREQIYKTPLCVKYLGQHQHDLSNFKF